MVPNFFLVGAEKGGTTSVYRYLAAHPDVFMSPVKEPLWYGLDPQRPKKVDPSRPFTLSMARDQESYERLFDGVTSETAIGEATTGYLRSERATERIANEVPCARITMVLRDPAVRAHSAHRMYTGLGLQAAVDLDTAIDAELAGEAKTAYLRNGFYADDVSRYLERFGPERVHIFLHDDLSADPTGTMAGLYQFLGVDPGFVPDTTKRFNVAKVPRNATVHQLAKGSNPAKTALKRVLPASLRARIKQRAIAWNESVPEGLGPDTRRRLVEIYADDIDRLEVIIGRDLSAWKQC